MYAPDTILTKKDPLPEPNPAGKTDEERAGHPLAAYNRIRVVGPSPVQYSGQLAEWQGGASAGVLIQPTPAFGPTVDRPLGELQRDYEIESEPETTFEMTQKIRIIDAHSRQAGLSPEEVFASGAQKSIPKSKGIPSQMAGMQ